MHLLMKTRLFQTGLACLFATFSLSAMAECRVTEQQLLGAWTQLNGEGFFEDMAFSLNGKQRRFSSWLHQRPEISGARWSLKQCRLTIDSKTDASLSFEFSVAMTPKGQLELREGADASPARYKRVP